MKALVIFAFAMSFLPLLQERPLQNEDAVFRLKLINEEIAKTTPGGKDVIDRV